MKRILLAPALLLAAPAALATPSRVVSMGELSRYITDDSSILTYPGLLPTYSHFVYADLGGPSGISTTLNDVQATGLNGGAMLRLAGGLHLGVLTSDFTPGEQEAFLQQVGTNASDAGGSDIGGGLASLPKGPMRRYDLLAAFEITSRLAIGMRLAYGSNTKSYQPTANEKDTDTKACDGGCARKSDYGALRRVDFSTGISGQIADGMTFDVAAGLNHYGVTYLKDNDDGSNPAFMGGGGNAFEVSARGRFVLSRYWDIVPQLGWRGAFFSLTQDQSVPPLADAFGGNADPSKKLDGGKKWEHSMSRNVLDAGTALVLRAAPGAEFWLAVGMQMAMDSGSVVFTQTTGATRTQDDATRTLSLPYVKFGVEAVPLDWLRLRVGVEKYDWTRAETSTVTRPQNPDKQPTGTWSTDKTLDTAKDLGVYAGIGFFYKGFALDLLVDNEFFNRGPNVVSGASGNFAKRASLSYQF